MRRTTQPPSPPPSPAGWRLRTSPAFLVLLLLALAPFPARAATFWTDDATNHWAFQPIHPRTPPALTPAHADRARTDIDRFILARLREKELEPARPAARRDLLRRATFDLTGLPPTAAEIAAFEYDTATNAFERCVDRLLDSPRYGERWGRWWLDVARYADTNGQDENKVMANAWRYRDWVIRAFNANLPLDEFVLLQLAGDLLPLAGSESEQADRLTATGFLVLGPKMLAEQDKPKLVMDLVDEQIDTVGRAFLGLTLGCARCHDHKFDPVTARDYYALAGIFKSTRTMANLDFVSKFNERRIAPAAEVAAFEAHRKRFGELTNRLAQVVRLANSNLLAAWKRDLPLHLAAALAPPESAPAPAPGLASNLVQNLRAILAPDPATNRVSAGLRALVTQPERLARLLGPVGDGPEARADDALRDALFGPHGAVALPTNPRPFLPAATRDELAALEQQRDTLLASAPATPAMALAVADDKPTDLPVHLRGNHLNPAKEPVPRGFIQVVTRANPAPPIPPDQSGRLQLARWLVAPSNPLTARVLVNRVWQAHFSEGLVRSPDNFGLRGEPPSHPELLDWLAHRFIQSGWDLKALHRLILASAVYRQSTAPSASHDTPARGRNLDPDNRLLRHFPRRRLDAEMIRDAVLAATDRLDATPGGSLVNWKNDEYAPGDEVSGTSLRRTVYLPIVRDRTYDALLLFDFANPSVCTAKRVPTVVSQQALFFLNSPLIKDSAAHLARQLNERPDLDAHGRIRWAFHKVLGRAPEPAELARCERFLREFDPKISETSVVTTPDAKPIPAPGEAIEALEALEALCQTLLGSNEFVYRP